MDREDEGVYHLNEFTAWLVSWGASKNTVNDRTIVIRSALRTWGVPPNEVTQRTIEGWLASEAFAPWTRATYFSHVRSYFHWMAEQGYIDQDPVEKMRRPRSPKGKPRPLSPDEAQLALCNATGHLRAWLVLGMLAGMRVHEIAKLRGEEINEETIYILGKGGRSGFVPTHPELWALARRYPRQGWWFPSDRSKTGHLNSQSITTAVSRYFAGLQIEGSVHRCRHTYGTNLLRGGANLRVVQKLMRHESLATTALYTAVDEDELRNAIRGLGA